MLNKCLLFILSASASFLPGAENSVGGVNTLAGAGGTEINQGLDSSSGTFDPSTDPSSSSNGGLDAGPKDGFNADSDYSSNNGFNVGSNDGSSAGPKDTFNAEPNNNLNSVPNDRSNFGPNNSFNYSPSESNQDIDSNSGLSDIEKNSGSSINPQDNIDVSNLIEEKPQNSQSSSPDTQVDPSVSDLKNQYTPESVTNDQSSLQVNDQLTGMDQDKASSPDKNESLMKDIKDLGISEDDQVNGKHDGQLGPKTDNQADTTEDDMYNSDDTKPKPSMDVQPDPENDTSSNHLKPEFNQVDENSSSADAKEGGLENPLYGSPQVDSQKGLDSDFNKSKSDVLNKARSIRTNDSEFDGKLDDMIDNFESSDSKTKGKKLETPIKSDLLKKHALNKEIDSSQPDKLDQIKDSQKTEPIEGYQRKPNDGPNVDSLNEMGKDDKSSPGSSRQSKSKEEKSPVSRSHQRGSNQDKSPIDNSPQRGLDKDSKSGGSRPKQSIEDSGSGRNDLNGGSDMGGYQDDNQSSNRGGPPSTDSRMSGPPKSNSRMSSPPSTNSPKGGYSPKSDSPKGGNSIDNDSPKGGHSPNGGSPRGGYSPKGSHPKSSSPKGGYSPEYGSPKGGSPKGSSPKGGYSPEGGSSKSGKSPKGGSPGKSDSKGKGTGNRSKYGDNKGNEVLKDKKYEKCANHVAETAELKSKSPLEQVLASTNCYRGIDGLPALQASTELGQQADEYSTKLDDDVMGSPETAHNVGGVPSSDRCKAAGFSGYCAENVSAVSEDVDTVMIGWMNSDGHRDNILRDSVTHMGAGHDSRYWTQIFASK